MRSCNCLNIIVHNDGAAKADFDSLNLSKEEISSEFFQQDLQRILNLLKIEKAHNALIQSKIVGDWIVNKCLNCNVFTHAVHREKGPSLVLISSSLLNREAIEVLRKSPSFSTIFHIIIPEVPNEERPSTYLSGEAESAIKSVKDLVFSALNKEESAVVERINKFSEEQYDLLKELRERATREQEALVRIICMTADQKPQSTNVHLTSYKNGKAAVQQKQMQDIPIFEKNVTSRHTPKRQKSSPAQVNSFDAEGLFEFEGIDDSGSYPGSEADDSDKEDIKEAIKIPRSRSMSVNIAKSLPVQIPPFLANVPNTFPAEDFDDVPHEEHPDIAASIKALAKSVHGDTVFGDLPKPRLSTQI